MHAIFLMGEGARANGGGVCDGSAYCRWFLQRSTDSSVAGPELLCFLVMTAGKNFSDPITLVGL
jgi:hypothetical protein